VSICQGFRFYRDQIFDFPIGNWRRRYNSAALPRSLWQNAVWLNIAKCKLFCLKVYCPRITSFVRGAFNAGDCRKFICQGTDIWTLRERPAKHRDQYKWCFEASTYRYNWQTALGRLVLSPRRCSHRLRHGGADTATHTGSAGRSASRSPSSTHRHVQQSQNVLPGRPSQILVSHFFIRLLTYLLTRLLFHVYNYLPYVCSYAFSSTEYLSLEDRRYYLFFFLKILSESILFLYV